MSLEKSIVHIDMDTFFVSCERLIDSRLNGKPILIGGTGDRGVVASCSYEARRFGVRSAMPMKLARGLCPEALVIRGNTNTYSKYSNIVTDIIKESAPVYEKSSIDEFYIDLSGMDRFYGSMLFATELRERIIRETGLPLSFGLSQNKTVSKIATGEAKPNNKIQVKYGTEKVFLAPLSVRKIPYVGAKSYQTLRTLGVKHIKTIQQMPLELMERTLGKNGVAIWEKANGIDTRPVVPYNERKSISTERTFEKDTIDVLMLKGIITAIAENLAFQLRKGKKVTSCISIKIRYSDFNTHTLQKHIPYTAADHDLIPLALELFDKLYSKRLLIRLIGVKMSKIVGGGHQINLFNDSEEVIRLYQAMDNLRDKFGDRIIMRASGMKAKTISRFNPFNGEAPIPLANRRA